MIINVEDDFLCTKKTWNYVKTRLVNQIYKMLPMFEKQEDWKKQLNTVILECKGYNYIFKDAPDLFIMIAKLNSLNEAEDHLSFRKTIFEIISILKETDYGV